MAYADVGLLFLMDLVCSCYRSLRSDGLTHISLLTCFAGQGVNAACIIGGVVRCFVGRL